MSFSLLQFGFFETITSGIIDFFPRQLITKRSLVNILVGLIYFVTSIPFTMNVRLLTSTYAFIYNIL